jgi:hypothetical protein
MMGGTVVVGNIVEVGTMAAGMTGVGIMDNVASEIKGEVK